ncbi:MAG: MarR family winged helix-turn-helix transcriptional regulator, partial [Hydrogenophaga sp.]|uniref:MarR family winged helix-turn-helix transcriptional regulator n=1 Tax=Hydrogenophaga sp. TaxID=1904254 RepID=UPI0040358DB6
NPGELALGRFDLLQDRRKTGFHQARGVGLTNPSMVPLADKLAERGLIDRTRQEHDRRTVYLKLTPEGRKCWSRAARIVREHEAALRAALSDAETAELIRLLGKITGD